MAEFVQRSIEEMLPELEQMSRVELFTVAETRNILKNRKAFEYKLRRHTKLKENFLQYIQYEINLLALVRKRRQRTGYKFKKVEIDVAIKQRIHKLFKLACNRFQSDVKLFLSHIEFCKTQSDKVYVGRILTQMLQIHTRKPELWIFGAQWEMDENGSMDNARSLLQRGLRFNATSKLLWLEYFRMELLNADKLRREREYLRKAKIMKDEENEVDPVLEGKVAVVVFKQALNTFPGDIEFLLSFLPINRDFEFTADIESDIFTELKEKYSDHELAWDAMARREMLIAQAIALESHTDKLQRDMEIYRAEHSCFNIYEKAVQQLNTDKMWTLYLAACMERVAVKCSRALKEKRLQQTLKVFSRASDQKKISEEMLLQWIEVLQKTGQVEELDRVTDLALQQYPGSLSLWQQRLNWLATKQEEELIILQELDNAVNRVSDKKSLPLWQWGVEYYLENCPSKLQDWLERGITQQAGVSVPLKEVYLQCIFVQQGIEACRKLYKRLVSKPLSVDFFRKYIEIETSQPHVKAKKLRRAYENSLDEYGHTMPDLWLEYIKFETNHPKGKPENAGKLHWRAMKMLDGEYTATFVTQYTLLQTGHL